MGNTTTRLITKHQILQIGPETARARGGSWGPPPGSELLGEPTELSLWGRIGYHSQSMFGGSLQVTSDGTIRPVDPSRLLTPEQLHLIYVRTPDVRSSIDSIVRRVATWDWDVVPLLDPASDDMEEAQQECTRLREWLKTPTADEETWQELLTAFLTDLLKYDAGVFELVPGPKDTIEEIPTLKGSDVHPVIDEQGRLIKYVQEPRVGIRTAPAAIDLPAEQVLYMRLFANTEGPEGIPLLESLIYEVIAILRGFESVAKSLDANEIPAGLLVLTGLAKEAGQRAKDEYEQKKGQDHKMRVIVSDKPAGAGGIDARWIEFKKLPRELQILELSREISRTIWRVFGVMPVEQGATDGMPRATAQVQMDASSSHLIEPILELLAAKLNSKIIRRQVAKEWAGLVEFQFIRRAKLTPEQALDRAKELTEYVSQGILTRNEARMLHPEGPFSPIAGGDIPTVRVPGGAVIPLVTALILAPDGGDTGEDDLDDVEDASGVEDENGDDVEDADDKEEAASKGKRPVMRLLPVPTSPGRASLAPAIQRGRRGKRAPAIQRSIMNDSPPADWVSDRFKGYRTLKLRSLWEEISGYTRDVLPLWEEARAATVSVLAREYKQSGFDAEARGRVMDEVSQELDRLSARWMLAVSPRYERVALDARTAAGNITALSTDPAAVRAAAGIYRDQAIGYLNALDGPLAEMRRRIGELLVSVSDVRAGPPPDRRLQRAQTLSPDSSPVTVLTAMAAIWDSVRSRISMWSGKLTELSNNIFSSELEQGASTGQAMGIEDAVPGDSVEWWCEWVSQGGSQICSDCQTYSSQGYMRLADLPTRPGGAVQCRSNCHCVLVLWTRAEIDGGRAHYLGENNLKRT